MEENVIPGNLHFKEPNEHIPSLKDGRLEVVKENKNWSGGIIGLNSFGFGGANAHVIIKSNQKEKMDHEGCDKPRLFMYGSRTKEAAEHVIKMAQDHPTNIDLHKLWNETAHMSLSTHPYRGFTILNGSETDIDVKVRLSLNWCPSCYHYYKRSMRGNQARFLLNWCPVIIL